MTVTANTLHFTLFSVVAYAGPSTAVKPPTAAGAGVFAATPVFGPAGQALAVFLGGTTAQLEAAAAKATATGVWVQDPSRRFHLLVVNGPAFLRDDFVAAFPLGFPNTLAVTLVR